MRGLVLTLLLACRTPPAPDPLASLHEDVDTSTPEAPLTVLLEATASDDAEVRALAMTWLIRSAHSDALPTFAAIGVSDGSPHVRVRSIRALGERTPTPIALAALSQAMGEGDADPWVSAEAAHQLRGHADEEAVASLAQQLADTAPTGWGYAPLALAASLHDIEGAREALCQSLTQGGIAYDVDWLARLTEVDLPCLGGALEAAQSRVEPEILPTLKWVRHQRGELPDRDLTAPVLQLDETSQLEFLDLVARGDLVTAEPTLKAMAAQSSDTGRAYASLLLSEAQPHRTYPRELQAMATSPDPLLRAISVDSARRCSSRVLPQKTHLICREIIARGLEDPQAIVRREAAEAAPSLNPAPAQVQRLRTDPFLWNRVQAAGILLQQNPDVVQDTSENPPDSG